MADITNSNLFSDTGILKQDACVILVKTEWNAEITNELENGCADELNSRKIKNDCVVVPGAFEIPFAIRNYWEKCSKKKKPDAFIALGCVIKGDTPHFDYICKAVTEGILQLNLKLPVPVIFGVLTVNDEMQAKARIGGDKGHKGREAAITAIKMINLSVPKKKSKSNPGKE